MTSYFNRMLAATAFTVAVTGMTGCNPADSTAATQSAKTTPAGSYTKLSEKPHAVLACTKDNLAARHEIALSGEIPASISEKSLIDGFEKVLNDAYGKYTINNFKKDDAVADMQLSLAKYFLQFDNKDSEGINIKSFTVSDDTLDTPDPECVSRTAAAAAPANSNVSTKSSTPPADISFTADDATLHFCTKDHHSVEVYLYATFKPQFVNGVQINSTKKFFDEFGAVMQGVFQKYPKDDFEERPIVNEARNYQARAWQKYLLQSKDHDGLEGIDIVDIIMSDSPAEECRPSNAPRITSTAPRP